MRTALPLQYRALVAIVLVLAGCRDNTGPARAGPPAALVQVTGDGQVGVVAQALPAPLVVRVADADGTPLPNTRVEFRAAPGSGQAQTAFASTDVNGLARTMWTLGPAARVAQRLDATVQGATAPSLSVTFSATGTPDALAQLIKSGDTQVGSLGAALAESLAVVAADRFDNGIPGITITWTVSSGDGTVAARAATTDTLGTVRASWVLGARLNVPHVVTATAEGVAPANFSATAQLPETAVITPFSGSAQRDTVGRAVAESLAARVTLTDGTPIEGATVTWAIAAGGGGIAPATSATDRDGVARAEWTLGTTAGDNAATATAAPLAPVTFAATGVADSPASVMKVLGDDQHGVPGQLAPDSLVVMVSDQYGNGVPGTEVVFAIAVGDGGLSAARVMTNDAGRAAIALRLGTTGVDNEVNVSAGNVPPVRFTVSGTPGDDWTLAIRAGDGQATQTKGSLTGFEVRLTDGQSRPVPGASVAWSAAGGTPGVAITSTNADGIASNSWVVGCPASQTMTATVESLAPVTFTAEVARRPAYVANFRRPPWNVAVYSTHPLQVRIKDEVDCPVSGVAAPWSILNPPNATWPVGMKIEPVTQATSDSAGRIDFVLSAGGLIQVPSCAGLPDALSPYHSDSTENFCVVPNANVTSLTITPAVTVMPTPGASVALRAIALDEAGHELFGVAQWKILNPDIATGVREGYDRFRVTGIRAGTAWAVAENNPQGPYPGSPSAIAEIRVKDVPGPAAMVSAGNWSDLVGSIGLPRELIAYVTDAAGTPVPGATVAWALESGNGSLATSSSISDSLGEARTTFTPGPVSGSNVVTATLSGVGVARYLVWTPAGDPARIVIGRGNAQTGFVGHQLPDSISVRVEDYVGNGVYNQEVVFATVTGGGHVERTMLRTDTLGVASTRWTPGSLGMNTATASWSGQSITFAATAVAGGGMGFTMPNGSELSITGPPIDAYWASPVLVVRVIDDQGAPVPGATVTWTGSVTTVTDADGMTSHASPVLIGGASVQRLTASLTSGATAVFSVITVPPLIAPVFCGWNAGAQPMQARVGTRLPGAILVSCYSRQGAPWTTASFRVTGPMGQGYGGSLMPAPGYRPPGRTGWYWVLPRVPGTYYFWISGFPGAAYGFPAEATP